MSGFYRFVSNRRHVLISLIRLEFIRIIIFFILIRCYAFDLMESYLSMFYLVFRACEGAFGLGVIVFVVRGFGNDIFNSVRTVQC